MVLLGLKLSSPSELTNRYLLTLLMYPDPLCKGTEFSCAPTSFQLTPVRPLTSHTWSGERFCCVEDHVQTGEHAFPLPVYGYRYQALWVGEPDLGRSKSDVISDVEGTIERISGHEHM